MGLELTTDKYPLDHASSGQLQVILLCNQP